MPANPIPALLLDWYDHNGRILPWRQLRQPRQPLPDPYGVWLSEIMLQQTTVQAAAPYWQRFLELWPTVDALAKAPDEQVMHEWAGLGYYARARNLLATARIVAEAGCFPRTSDELIRLPGIGPYTAAAIAAIAWGEATVMLDTNAERVGARLFAIATALPKARKEIRSALQPLVPVERPGDFGQALMDIGATICTASKPGCNQCPLAEHCRANQLGTPERWPQRQPRRPRPVRYGSAWWIMHGDHTAWVRRPPSGLLGGMLGLPGTAWGETPGDQLPFSAEWQKGPTIRHVFTHFELHLTVYSTRVSTRVSARPLPDWPLIWRQGNLLAGLPTLYARATRAALSLTEQA